MPPQRYAISHREALHTGARLDDLADGGIARTEGKRDVAIPVTAGLVSLIECDQLRAGADERVQRPYEALVAQPLRLDLLELDSARLSEHHSASHRLLLHKMPHGASGRRSANSSQNAVSLSRLRSTGQESAAKTTP